MVRFISIFATFIALNFFQNTVYCGSSSDEDEIAKPTSLSLIETFDLGGGLPESAVYDPVNDEYVIGRILGFELRFQDATTLEFLDNKTISIVTPAAMVVIPETNTLYVNSPLNALGPQIVGYDLTTQDIVVSYSVPPDPVLGIHICNGLCYDPVRNYLCYTDFGIDPFTQQPNFNGLLACLNLETEEFFEILSPSDLNGDNPNGCDIKGDRLYLAYSDVSLEVTTVVVCDLDTLECEQDPDWKDYAVNQKNNNNETRLAVAESVQFIDDCYALIGTFEAAGTQEIGIITSYNICIDDSSSSDSSSDDEAAQPFSTGEYIVLAEEFNKNGDLGFDFNRDIVIVPEQNSGTFRLMQVIREEDSSDSSDSKGKKNKKNKNKSKNKSKSKSNDSSDDD